jgi:hypothetical protein
MKTTFTGVLAAETATVELCFAMAPELPPVATKTVAKQVMLTVAKQAALKSERTVMRLGCLRI